jgi:hypothetical protein
VPVLGFAPAKLLLPPAGPLNFTFNMRSFIPLVLLASVPLLAAQTPAPLRDVVSLPEFTVYADRPLPSAESWRYVRFENFEVLSNASARTTARFVKDLREFQIVLSIVSPMARIRSELPVTIVLCAKGNAFEQFAVKPTVRSLRGLGTTLLRDGEIATILVDYESQAVSEPLAFYPFTEWVAERDVHASEEFFREYIHLALSQIQPRPPAWLAEGLANIYSRIEYTNKWIEVGLPKSFTNDFTLKPGFTGSASGDLVDAFWNAPFSRMGSDGIIEDRTGFPGSLSYGEFGERFNGSRAALVARAALLPLRKVFSVGYDSPELRGQSDHDDHRLVGWQQQATAFVHMCLYGQNGRYRQPFLKFALRAQREPVTEQMFKECFGQSYRQMELELRGYIDFTYYTSTVYKSKNGDYLKPVKPIEVRQATDAEVGRIKGEAFRLAGRDDDARREFVVAYLRGERDPQLLASLGLMARQRHDDTRARTYLEAVATSGAPVPRPRAYLELARLRLADIRMANHSRPLTGGEDARVLTPLFTAQQLPPALPDVYLEIANVWESSSVAPTRANLGALEYGARLFPRHAELSYRTAALLNRYGYKADAGTLVTRALGLTRDPQSRAKLEQLRREIDNGAPAGAGGGTARVVPESALTPELRLRLADYRAAKSSLIAELHAKIDAVSSLVPAAREQELKSFAAEQAVRLRTLRATAAALESDLGWSPDENDDYGLVADGTQGSNPKTADMNLLRTALLRRESLSPPQCGLVREMILQNQQSAAVRGAFCFFSPDTARLQLPDDLPAALAARIAAYRQEKDALKQELRSALAQLDEVDSDFVRTMGLAALAEQQAPRFGDLENLAETIRSELATLPPRPAMEERPELPAPLAARLAAYQNSRNEVQASARRDLQVLRAQLADTGAEIVASGEPPRLELRVRGTPTAAAQLPSIRSGIESFNRQYADRFGALASELGSLRRAVAENSTPRGNSAAKSVDDLTRDFISAALRQSGATSYRDCRVAVLWPGLSPEQRRLLFGQLGEKQPSLVIGL